MIDFANVRNIVIPEGEVFSIARGAEILWQKSRLPFEYQEVEYLESTGKQYIDTGINPDDDFGYKVDFEQTYSNSEQCPLACMDSNNRFVGAYFTSRPNGTNTNSIYVGWATFAAGVSYPQGFNINQRVISSSNYLNDRAVLFNGYELLDLTQLHIKGTINNTLYLFNRHYGSTAPFYGKIYSAVISKGDEIFAHFIPCYRKGDGKPGMYDIVTGTFFTNAGTGEFIYA